MKFINNQDNYVIHSAILDFILILSFILSIAFISHNPSANCSPALSLFISLFIYLSTLYYHFSGQHLIEVTTLHRLTSK